ncbi:MAG: hypothetical protein P1V35_00045 [Planctomycetota bacterium]|nr:hypothetical protein [Planctomycetota bacterium]
MKAPFVLLLVATTFPAPAPAGPQKAASATPVLDAPRVTFTSPALGKVWAAAGPETKPAPMPLPATELASSPFGPIVLEAWAQALQAARNPQAPLGTLLQSRLKLCLIAKAQGRDQDAWTHFQKLADGPDHVVRALPYLWPGVPFDTSIGPGARLTLEPNTLLEPAFLLLPPDDETGVTGPLRMTWKGGLNVLSEPLELRITLQPEGLEMDLWNRGRAPLKVRAILPNPRNFESSYTYSDWEKTLDAHLGIAVVLPHDREDPWTLFTRLKPAFEAWPRSPRSGTPWFKDRSMRLILGRNEPPTPALNTLAKVLRDLLAIPVEFGVVDDETPSRCVLVDLGPLQPTPEAGGNRGASSPRQARMRRLLSSVELFLLP